MSGKGRVYSKKYRRIQSEITKLLASTEPSSAADLAVSDISDFHVGDVLACRENVRDVSSSDQSKTLPLNLELARWAAKYNLSRESLNDLLLVLNKYGYEHLQKDARALLKTPRRICTQEICGGFYAYFGVQEGLIRCINKMDVVDFSEIKLNVNIDGLPLFKSSLLQMWPILGMFLSDVFIVALYCGKSKPHPVDDFLKDFVLEVKHLCVAGIAFNKRNLKFRLGVFICDAPARGFLKQVVGHTAKHACERCEIVGEYVAHRVVFKAQSSYLLRSDASFNQLLYLNGHQIGVSPLSSLGASLINDFVLDYMHLVCLGATKRILTFLKQGPRTCRLSNFLIGDVSNRLLSLHGKLPSDFSRQPRSLSELDRWKATEFRQFLLYTGPLVLKAVLHSDMYKHFLLLHVSVSILLNSNAEFRRHYLSYARDLLHCFVENAATFYGETFVVYNIHSLVHLSEDAENQDCSLNEISAFPFENFLQTLKKQVRNGNNPISQVAKRQFELQNVRTVFKTSKRINLSVTFRDSCFLHQNSFFMIVEKLADDNYLCNCLKVKHTESFYTSPLDSKVFDIGFVDNFDEAAFTSKGVLVLKTEIVGVKKVSVLPFNSGFVYFPLLHESEQK